MILDYDRIKTIYFYKNNGAMVDKLVAEKYKMDLNDARKCLHCGHPLPRTSWLCPYNEYQCIVAFFNENPEILVEAITHET